MNTKTIKSKLDKLSLEEDILLNIKCRDTYLDEEEYDDSQLDEAYEYEEQVLVEITKTKYYCVYLSDRWIFGRTVNELIDSIINFLKRSWDIVYVESNIDKERRDIDLVDFDNEDDEDKYLGEDEDSDEINLWPKAIF